MSKSKMYAFGGGIFGLIAILAVTRHEILLGVAGFAVAIGCAVRANSEWKREQA